jgi:ribosome-associated translation inhibitor RaiA
MKTKTIKQMYDELNAEVILKIKEGDFTVTKTEKHVATIEVEGLTFSFWIANGWEFLESNGSFDHENAVTLTMTIEDKKAIFDLIGLSDEDRVRMEIEELQEKIDLMKSKLEKTAEKHTEKRSDYLRSVGRYTTTVDLKH